ncbi:MAG: hypothetical protein ABIK28_14910 [Planctomycetota bacterium]
MKVTGLWMTGVLLLFCTSLVCAEEPGILSGVKIKDGLNPLKLSYDVNPFVVDWNNDGLKDLLVGEFTQGYINLYLNQGTNLNPVFNGGTQLQSNGSPITTTYG